MSHIEAYDTVSLSPTYLDLRRMADDRTVLKNPHKGWYYHYIDNGYGRAAYRDGIKRDEDLAAIPGLDHLYLRFDWCDVEPERGKFDWSYLDSIIGHFAPLGYTFSFRLCTFEGDNAQIPCATPQWVFDRGAKYRQLKAAREPDYGDEVYLEALEELMAEFGRKYARDPRVEYADVGTFGTWGEGHTFAGSQTSFSYDVLRRHVDLHLKYLPGVTLLVNDDMIYHLAIGGDSGASVRFMDYCAGKGLGIRDDSLGVNGYVDAMNYDTLRSDFMFPHFYKTAPVDLEYEHYSAHTPDRFKSGLPSIDALRGVRATYAGFHGYPTPWLDDNLYLTEYLANRLGYWYIPVGVDAAQFVSGLPSLCKVYIENKGFAPAYRPYELRIALTPGGRGAPSVIGCLSGDNLRWAPGEVTESVVRTSLEGVAAGDYGLALGLFEGERPIKLGLTCETANGYYVIGRTSVRKF